MDAAVMTVFGMLLGTADDFVATALEEDTVAREDFVSITCDNELDGDLVTTSVETLCTSVDVFEHCLHLCAEEVEVSELEATAEIKAPGVS